MKLQIIGLTEERCAIIFLSQRIYNYYVRNVAPATTHNTLEVAASFALAALLTFSLTLYSKVWFVDIN